MTRTTGVVVALILGILVLPGCKSSSVLVQDTLTMILSASPTDPETNQNVSFTLTANASQVIVQSRIDFETDGVWDDTRVHSTMDVAETFVHSYPSTGSRNVTAEITTSDQASEFRATTVNVVVPRLLVEYTLLGQANFGIENCSALGPPYAPPGVFFPLPQNVETHRETLGLFDSGSTASMSQEFGLDCNGCPGICDFAVTLYVGQSIIGQDFCSDFATCTINVQGTVP